MKVALYGGSFDPPHIAHESIVLRLRELDFVDQVVVMPTYLNPFKSSFGAPAPLRLKWLREIFAPYEDVIVSSYEVDLGAKTPTIRSVEHLLESYDGVYVVIGADNLAKLYTWHEFERLSKMVTFIVASRDGTQIPEGFISLDVDVDISSTQLRANPEIEKLPALNAAEIAQFYKENNAKQN